MITGTSHINIKNSTWHTSYIDTGTSIGDMSVIWISVEVDSYPENELYFIDEEEIIDPAKIKSLRREASLVNSFDIAREHQNCFKSFKPWKPMINRKFALRGSRV